MANKGAGVVIEITADSQVDRVFANVQQQMRNFGSAGSAGFEKLNEGAGESIEKFRLMEESLGIKMPRALTVLLAKMPQLQSAVSGMVGGFAALAGAEVLVDIGERVYSLWKQWYDVDEVVDKYYDKLEEVASKDFLNVSSVEAATSNLEALNKEMDALDRQLEKAAKGLDAWSDKSEKQIQEQRMKVQAQIDQAKKAKVEQDFQAAERAVAAEKELNNQKLVGANLALANGRLEQALDYAKQNRQKKLNELENDAIRKVNAHNPDANIPTIPDDDHADENALEDYRVRAVAAAQAYKMNLETREETARAHAMLMVQTAEQEYEKEKGLGEEHLAEIESLRSRGLMSDVDFIKEKQKIEDADLDHQKERIAKAKAAWQDLLDFQKKDPLLHRGAAGMSSKEEQETQAKLTEQDTASSKVDVQRSTTDTRAGGDAVKAQQDQDLELLKQAAELEAKRNDSIQARLALIRAETALRVQQAEASFGKGSQQETQASALGQVEAAKLRIVDIDRQISDIEKESQLAIDKIKADEQARAISKLQAQKEIAQQEAKEAQLIAGLLPLYEQQAHFLGSEYQERVQQLQAQIKKLNEPQKAQGMGEQFMGQLQQGFAGFADSVVSATTRGKNAFHDFGQSVIEDLERMMAKMFEELVLQKEIAALFGAVGGLFGGATGGAPASGADPYTDAVMGIPMKASGGPVGAGPVIVGEEGPEIFTPHMPGTIIPNAGIRGLGGNQPTIGNMSVSLVNQSANPVQPVNVSTSFDASAKSMVVSVVLDDLASNGPIGQALGVNQS